MHSKILSAALASVIAGILSAATPSRPNIVVIVSDDQGYADISFNPHHPKEVSTPHLDALARESVFFNQGYISGPVCSPTRAGLMLGRYQQRVGVYSAGDGGRGFDPTLPIFPAMLPAGTVSMALGKWHLGLDEDYPELKWHPVSRGFTESYNFMGRGAHDYFRLTIPKEGDEGGPMYRGKQRIDDQGYLTTRLSEEAVAFIGRNKAKPFFVYLAYNAVHAPAQAPKEDIERVRREHPGLSETRTILMAMLRHLDLGVGSVVKKLKDEGLWENTLLFFITDNGGARAMEANNAPLRGAKSTLFEGGIRTPFIVSWPAHFKGGRTIDAPVISLDILPTVLDALGQQPPAGTTFDGKSLLPLLTGKTEKHHETLYWSTGALGEWAVRRGDWKLHFTRGSEELANLRQDPSEKNNLAAQHPEKVKELKDLYERWLEPMAEPITGGSKRWTGAAADAERKAQKKDRAEKKAERKKARRKP